MKFTISIPLVKFIHFYDCYYIVHVIWNTWYCFEVCMGFTLHRALARVFPKE